MIDYSKVTFTEIDTEDEPTQVFYTYNLTENELDAFLTNYIETENIKVTGIELCLSIFSEGDYKLEALCNAGYNKIWVELVYQFTNADVLLELVPKEDRDKI